MEQSPRQNFLPVHPIPRSLKFPRYGEFVKLANPGIYFGRPAEYVTQPLSTLLVRNARNIADRRKYRLNCIRKYRPDHPAQLLLPKDSASRPNKSAQISGRKRRLRNMRSKPFLTLACKTLIEIPFHLPGTTGI